MLCDVAMTGMQPQTFSCFQIVMSVHVTAYTLTSAAPKCTLSSVADDMCRAVGSLSNTSLPSYAEDTAVCRSMTQASLHSQAVDELLTLLGGIQACCLLRCAGAMRMLTWRRVWRGFVQDCSIVDNPVGRAAGQGAAASPLLPAAPQMHPQARP